MARDVLVLPVVFVAAGRPRPAAIFPPSKAGTPSSPPHVNIPSGLERSGDQTLYGHHPPKTTTTQADDALRTGTKDPLLLHRSPQRALQSAP